MPRKGTCTVCGARASHDRLRCTEHPRRAMHGTVSKASMGCACYPCRFAKSEYDRAWYARRRELVA